MQTLLAQPEHIAPPPRVRATRSAGREMRSRLLDAASRLFRERGLAAVAIADIAKAATKHGQWHAETHGVFAGGIRGMPMLSTAGYAPEAGSGGASAAAQYGSPGYIALAAAMDAALAELKIELAKVKAPSPSS